MTSQAEENREKLIERDGGAETPQRADGISVKELALLWRKMCERADKAGR